MPEICRVATYTNQSYEAALSMACDEFALARKHAYITRLNETEEGRKYLSDCERMATTEPDFAALRRMDGYTAKE